MICGTDQPPSSSTNFYGPSARLKRYENDRSNTADFRALGHNPSATNHYRLEKIYRVLCSGRDRQDDFAERWFPRCNQTRYGWYDYLVASVTGRRNHSLP